jgi:hypothetical protein
MSATSRSALQIGFGGFGPIIWHLKSGLSTVCAFSAYQLWLPTTLHPRSEWAKLGLQQAAYGECWFGCGATPL